MTSPFHPLIPFGIGVVIDTRRKAKPRPRPKGAPPLESAVEKAIIQAFKLRYRVTLTKTDAGGAKHRHENQIPVMLSVPKCLALIMGCPQELPFGIGMALRLPKGFPDLLGEVSPGKLLFIECKRPGGKATLEQVAFLAARNAEGHVAFVADSVDSALAQFCQAMATRSAT